MALHISQAKIGPGGALLPQTNYHMTDQFLAGLLIVPVVPGTKVHIAIMYTCSLVPCLIPNINNLT